MLPRRTLLQTPLALAAPPKKMILGMHQYTSAGAGYRHSLEGWAKAGIRHVEPVAPLLDDFLKTDTLANAKRVLTDNGLTIVSGAVSVMNLWEPNPAFEARLEAFRQRCEQFATLGAPIVYSPCVTAAKFTADDYAKSIDNIRRVAEVARQFRLKVGAEFVRNSTFLASLPTAIRLHREAAHPNFGIIFDCYHFWSGPNHLEDMDALRPGDGVAPLAAILRKLVDRGYTGPITVELFWPQFQQADPFTLAKSIKTKAEAIFKQARL
jgi:sugar phosphate isomerase/epimerase